MEVKENQTSKQISKSEIAKQALFSNEIFYYTYIAKYRPFFPLV